MFSFLAAVAAGSRGREPHARHHLEKSPVVGSLLYLAIQIRQNTRTVRSSTHHASVVAGNVVQLAFADDEAAEVVLKAGRSYEDLSVKERFRLTMLLRAFFSFEEDVFLQFQEGLVGHSFWEARTRVIVETLEQPGIRDWWTRNRHVYMAEFQQAIEELTARHSPEASP